jgi:predicted DNA-binding protein with PD1-like motif
VGAFGGHLEPGCQAYVVCEIFFAEVGGPTLTRRMVDVDVEGMGQGTIPQLAFKEG